MSSQQLARPKKTTSKEAALALDSYVRENAKAMRKVAAKSIDLTRLHRLVLSTVMKTPALWDCSTESIFRAMQQSAEVGLEPGTALGYAHIVPYKGEAQFQIGYKGYVELFRRSGFGLFVEANCVYEGDDFEVVLGLNPDLRHTPKFGPRTPNKIEYVYAVAQYRNGTRQFEVMTRAEVEMIRNRSAARDNGPWVTDWAEMAKKTVIRRLSKRLPMSVELRAAAKVEDAYDLSAIDAEFAPEIADLPALPEGPVEAEPVSPEGTLPMDGEPPAPQSKNAQLQ